MTGKDAIAGELERAFRGEAWHGPSLKEILADVTAREAAARPIAGAHSIWELVHHITAWVVIVRRRLEGERIVDVSEQEDWPPVNDTGEGAWHRAIAALEEGHQRLLDAIRRVPEARLAEPVAGKDYSNAIMLNGVVQHDLYHGGQMALLRKALRYSSA